MAILGRPDLPAIQELLDPADQRDSQEGLAHPDALVLLAHQGPLV